MSDKYSIQYKNFSTVEMTEPLPIQIQQAKNADRVIRFVASDETIDHDSEVIKQDGWDLSMWIANPVCQGFHDKQSWPLGRGVAIGVVDKKLLLDIEFDPPEIDERADMVFKKIKHGTVKAGSVGFIALKWVNKGEPGTEKMFKEFDGAKRIFTRCKLMEWTVCPIGANPNALVIQRAKQFDAVPFYEAERPESAIPAEAYEVMDRINKQLKGA